MSAVHLRLPAWWPDVRGVLAESVLCLLLGLMLGGGLHFYQTAHALEQRMLSLQDTARIR